MPLSTVWFVLNAIRAQLADLAKSLAMAFGKLPDPYVQSYGGKIERALAVKLQADHPLIALPVRASEQQHPM